MKNRLPSILVAFVLFILFSQAACNQKETNPSKFNFDFEQQENGSPVGWDTFGTQGYLTYLDSTTVKSGKYAAVIEHNEGEEYNFRAWEFILPENYVGNQITLSGYIKTENVTNGFAGLWMRIDNGIAFDNMHDRGITGTTDWTKYEVTLNMNPAKTQQIVIGGLLVGKGKMWLDDLQITIDGKEIKEATPYVVPDYPAKADKEFDSGSPITLPSLDDQLITNLDLLGKVWGFLKYNHPEIGTGNYNWDYELFRMLPGYLKEKDIKERDKYLLNWIQKYGTIPTGKDKPNNSENVFLKPDFSWLEKIEITADLKNKIEEIYQNRHQGMHFYIDKHFGVGNPDFCNESTYENMEYPDEGFRILALYRYWNMIQYFFPNRYMTDKNWNEVLKEYIPSFILAEDRLEYELAALQLIGEINDTHANLWGGGEKLSEWRGQNYAPFRVKFIEDKLVVTDSYNKEKQDSSGINRGDIITHIEGRTIETIIDSLKPYYPASNREAMLRDMSKDMLRSTKENLTIHYISSGRPGKKQLTLYHANTLNMYPKRSKEKCYKLLDNNIGYITLANIKDEDIPHIKEELKQTKGIIIDIRNYPSTFVPFALGSWFVSTTTPFVKFTIGNVDNPGEFTYRPSLEIPSIGEPYQGKLIVLVNEDTQSQAEYTAMALRAGANTTIIGSTTAGADGNVSTIMLPGGLRTMISGIGVFYPDGTETQRSGIVPDILVKPTIKGIKSGKDELLEKAIELIK